MAGGADPTGSDYRVDDRELLLGLYQRLLWHPIGRRLPARWHPNAITIAAQLFALVAALAAALGNHGILWCFPISSLCLMLYLSADNLDGYHARRTGQASALGELLDHGLDGIASAASLLATAYTFNVNGIWLVLLCAMGALAWLVTFWEQLARGELVIVRIGATEAFTLLVGFQLAMALGNRPPWLRFDPQSLTVGTAIIAATIAGYLWPIVPPIWRVANLRRTLTELLPLGLVSQLGLLLMLRPVPALAVALLVSLVSADLVARMIRRRLGESNRLLDGGDALLVAAIGLLLVASPRWIAAASWILASAAGLRYAVTLHGGIGRLRRHPAVAVAGEDGGQNDRD